MDRVEKMLGRMKASKLYRCVDWDPEGKAKDLVDKFNSASRSETMTRTGEYLGKLFAHMGKECYIEPPFYCDYGTNIHVGDYFYANTGLIVLDQCDVIIGDHAFLGPRVNIYCACHPIDAMIRNTGVELGKPVTIGDNVWIGGNTVINPGVTIGSNVVIGSGNTFRQVFSMFFANHSGVRKSSSFECPPFRAGHLQRQLLLSLQPAQNGPFTIWAVMTGSHCGPVPDFPI